MTPQLSELRVRAAHIKGLLRQNTRQRETHALAAVNGSSKGPKARSAIVKLDIERAELHAELKTVMQAQQIVWQQAKQQGAAQQAQAYLDGQMRSFRRNLPGWRNSLCGVVHERYESLAWHIQKLIGDKKFDEAQSWWLGTAMTGAGAHTRVIDAHTPIGAANIAKSIARGWCEPLCTTQKRTPHPTEKNVDVVTDVTNTLLLEKMMGELFDGLKLPKLPDTLGEFLHMYERKPEPKPLPLPTHEPPVNQEFREGSFACQAPCRSRQTEVARAPPPPCAAPHNPAVMQWPAKSPSLGTAAR